MASQVRRGILDMIGAARPSIADPFLPKKIEEGRIDDIRECIGCNICRAAFKGCVPIRCTQNPTMGEEWRRGWHPESIAPVGDEAEVLVVGAGPAGLEAARALGERGCRVTLADAGREAGGHLLAVSRLPGLQEWKRVVDWRTGQIDRLAHVACYRESRLAAEDVIGFGVRDVVIATGSSWVRDGIGRSHIAPIPGAGHDHVFSADDLLGGKAQLLRDPVVVYDDDHYALAGALAERLAREGRDVTLLTPAPEVSVWTVQTDEHHLLVPHLHGLGVKMVTLGRIAAIEADHLRLAHVQTGVDSLMECRSLVLVTSRIPNDSLVAEIASLDQTLNVTAIGDCLAPGLVVDAVYAGHRYAREFRVPPAARRVRRERVVLERCP